MLNDKEFLLLFPNSKIDINVLNEQLKQYDIISKRRYCHFIAQCAHESAGFSRLEENLNYSKNALLSVFSKYFNESTAELYARQPQNIANIVYANRMGNNNNNDGWLYRGRGIIQCTGKYNYSKVSSFINQDTLTNPNLLSSPTYASLSAIWYWLENDLNKYCDSDDIEKLTRAINGGYHGLEDRVRLYRRVSEFYDGCYGIGVVLKNGSRGIHVRNLQKLLCLCVDGIFGSGTEFAVKEYQKMNSLIADGVVGRKTWELLLKNS